MADAPLAGLRVIEFCSFVAGPLAGMLLAEQGADVIRVDPIGGAADRGRLPRAPDGTSIYWAGLNKHKRSVEVDVRSPAGRDVVRSLVGAPGAAGGVLLTNAVGASWLDIDELRAVRDDVIKVHIQGHPGGEPAVDYTVNAEVGFPLITGPPSWAAPVNHVLPAWDVITGTLAMNAVLAAERRRLLHGGGGLVEIALADVALAMAGHLGYLAEAETLDRERPATGNDVYGTYGTAFVTADGGHVMVTAITRRQWRALLEATGSTVVLDQVAERLGADFAEEADRYRHRELITGVLSPWFAARTTDEVAAALAGTAVLWSRYRSFRQALAEHIAASDALLDEIDQPGVGRHHAPHSVLRFAGTPPIPAAPAPVLGVHTREVLGEVLGIGDGEWAALVSDGVVRHPG